MVREENKRVHDDAVHGLGAPEDAENELVGLFGGTQQKTTMLHP